ncbi:MAG: ion channel [Celeribacter sp.]|jgi:hypothetical protein
MTALFVGVALVALLGVLHHFGVSSLRRVWPHPERSANMAILGSFMCLMALHLIEILLFAGAYRVLLTWPDFGSFSGDFDGSWTDLIYYSGINYTTLGFTGIDTVGPIKLVSMMQSLGGFMVLTWSATIIYAICSQAWEEK